MNTTQSQLTALLAAAVSNPNLTIDKNLLSDELLSEARAQCVSALLYCAVSPSDEDVRKEWKTYCLGTILHFRKILKVQSCLTELLISHGITPVILKGSAAGIAYPHPERRAYGDIDFFVKEAQFEQALSILRENGFSHSQEIRSYERHINLEKDGVKLEFHRFWCNNDSWDSPVHGDELNRRVFDAEPVEASVSNHRFFMLPTTENGLVLLQHINQHIAHGLGLRQILDWMLYVRANLTDDDWNRGFRDAAEYFGLKQLAVVISHMCMMYLGLEERAWYRDADESTCRELMDYILASGNFGTNLAHGASRKVQTVISSNRTLSGYFRHFQLSGIVHWPAAEKHKCLRPFAWIYGLGRCICLGLKRKNPIKELLSEMRTAKKRKKLLHKIRDQ